MQAMSAGAWEQLAARVHTVSSRPRMALLVALLLLERADGRGVVQTSRADLGHALWQVAGGLGYRPYRRERAIRSHFVSPDD
jgi:hypothetical protein